MKFTGPFGSWLKQRRKALDLTQMDLAGQVNCSVMTIRKIEGERRRPSKQIVERLADVLAISLDDRPAFMTFARQSQTGLPEPGLQGENRVPAHNLPPQPTLFVGRVRELHQIAERLEKSACRLLTLVGPGGIGKTRLALEAAGQMINRFADGVYFVPLASVSSPTLMASSIASTLRFTLYGSEEPSVQIIDYLRDKVLLLVLDNIEHLLDGIGPLTDILANAPQVKMLVTSRERLSVQEEWLLVVEGLSFPEDQATDRVEDYTAVQLFVQRAQQAHPTFSLEHNVQAVIAICQHVEGMPLGIELAATWLRVMPCHQIAEQMASNVDFLTTPLRNVIERHRNLRAVFDQSWRLLSLAEQRVLMRLSVFRGRFDLHAAEQVAGADPSVLAGLTDKSLVRMNASGHYDMHELLRQYVLDKLTASGEMTTVEQRHFSYFQGMAEQASEHYYSRDTVAWLDRLEANHDNFRAALQWALNTGQSELGLHLAVILAWFWRNRFYRREGRDWLQTLLARANGMPSFRQVQALSFAAYLTSDLGENRRAKALGEQALNIARSVGHQPTLAWSLTILGYIVKILDGGSQSVPLLEEALALFRGLDDKRGVDLTLRYMGRAMLELHDYERAARLLEEGLYQARQADAKLSIALHLCLLGNVSWYQGHNPRRTVALYQESLALFQEARDKFGVPESLLGLASVARAQMNFEESRRLYAESLATMDRETGHKYCIAEALWGLATVARAQGNYEEAWRLYQEALILNQGLDKWDTACCLAGLGGLLRTEHDQERAVRLLGAAAVLFDNHRDLYPADRLVFEHDVAAARAELGDVAFAGAWMKGQAMTLEEAVAYALEEVPGHNLLHQYPPEIH
jgi:predicted ATPase/DNA-binding XRE family transcriptional regulator